MSQSSDSDAEDMMTDEDGLVLTSPKFSQNPQGSVTTNQKVQPTTQSSSKRSENKNYSSSTIVANPVSEQKPNFIPVRDKLPAVKENTNVNIWNIIRPLIGKDLTKVAMPVILNEPLGALQKACEDLEYYDLLIHAQNCGHNNPVERMTYVALFVISAYYSSQFRASTKPFNPLLGESYEYQNEHFKFVAEQVSHHPPLSASYACSQTVNSNVSDGSIARPQWEFEQVMRYKTKFWGRSMELLPSGHLKLTFYDQVKDKNSGKIIQEKQEYTWNKITTCIQGLITGQRSVSNYGDITLTCKQTSLEGKISFEKKGGWGSSSSAGSITGKIYHANNPSKQLERLNGSWTEKVVSSSNKVWRGRPLPVNSESLYYGFTDFAMSLNYVPNPADGSFKNCILNPLPITDCRFRPDQRALENANLERAESEKLRLEQMQRDRRKEREEDQSIPKFKPKWFVKFGGNDEDFTYNRANDYFGSKDRNFEGEKFEGPLW